MSQKKFYQFLALTILLLFATDPTDFRATMTPLQGIVVWLIGMIVFGLTSCVVFLSYCWFSINVARIRIFSWFITLAGYLAGHKAALSLALAFSNNAHVPVSTLQIAFIGLAAVVIETIFFRWVMPHHLPQGQAVAITSAPPPEKSTNATISVGSRKVRLEVINYISSEEHYVRVAMRHETFVQRAKLADLVAQTTTCDGFQPHRSWWISVNAKPRFERSGSKPTLILEDGTIVPVARGRIKDTQDWIDAHANWTKPDPAYS